MILAGAPCDDVFVIALFSTFVTIAQGGSIRIVDFLNILVSIIPCVLLIIFVGLMIYLFFIYVKMQNQIRNTMKIVILLAVSFLLMAIETWAKDYIALSGLLAIVNMACVIKMKDTVAASKLSEKFGKLWIAAELMLFVLVGAAVDIRYALTAGFSAVGMIFIALIFRSVGVLICMLKTKLN